MFDRLSKKDLPFMCAKRSCSEEKTRSFDCEIFEDPVPEEIVCTICSKVNLAPLVCGSCSKSFCKPCFNKYRGFSLFFAQKTDTSCPSCGTKEVKDSSKALRKRIGHLTYKCQSCSESLPLSTFNKHKKECPNGLVTCALTKCGTQGHRKDFLSFVHNSGWVSETRFLACSERCKLLVEFEVNLDSKVKPLELYQALLSKLT